MGCIRRGVWTVVVGLGCALPLAAPGRAAAQTLFSDGFDRTSGLGPAWTVWHGGFSTDGARAVSGPQTPAQTGNWASVAAPLGTSDYAVRADLVVPAGSQYSGVFARKTSHPDVLQAELYAAQISASGPVTLYRRRAGAWSTLATVPGAGVRADVRYTLTLVVTGSSSVHLEVWLGGVRLITYDDAQGIPAGVPGMLNWNGGVSCDAFEVSAPPGASPAILDVPAAAAPVNLTGDLSEFAGAPAVAVTAGGATANFRMLWDTTFLYAAAQVTDPDLRSNGAGEDGALWDADAIEIMLDPRGTRAASPDGTFRHVILSATNQKYDATGAAGVGGSSAYDFPAPFAWNTVATGSFDGAAQDAGYRAVVRIPWAALGVTPVTGLLLGADLALDDRSAAGVATRDWANLSTTYAQPALWRQLRLVGGGGAQPPPAPGAGTGQVHAPRYMTGVTGGGPMPDWSTALLASCPRDGVTDARACLQAAADAARAQGRPLGIPPGTYAVFGAFEVGTSIGGVGGRPIIRQTKPGGAFAHDTLRLGPGMTGWIYNLHLVGTFDGTNADGEFGHNLNVGSVSGVTIFGNLFENAMGDAVSSDVASQDAGTRRAVNVIVQGNTMRNPYRCAVAFTGNQWSWLVLDNVIEKPVNYVSGIGLEPEVPGRVLHVEIAYNRFVMNNRTVNPMRGADGKAVFAWGTRTRLPTGAEQDNLTPGGDFRIHHNYGTFGTGFWGQGCFNPACSWDQPIDVEPNNREGESIPP